MENENDEQRYPLFMSRATTFIFANNDGCDDKSEVRLSLSGSHGVYKQILIAKTLKIGDRIKFDLSSLNIQASSAAVMYRCSDGIGRYIYLRAPIPAIGHFVTLSCAWVAQPNDRTVEEWFFVGS
ncbi:protein of unknown function (plasmid) [Cupriavidus taiwanensis]|nr:hypothetical protein [Cupriavidus taiwanensis]SPA03472.1 protein of unknown function [Cupriavidus taiwanensis]